MIPIVQKPLYIDVSEQLREMIQRDRNHACIFSWGLCNEVNGQNPAALLGDPHRSQHPGQGFHQLLLMVTAARLC